MHEEVERCSQRVKCLEVGDWLEALAVQPQWVLEKMVPFGVLRKGGPAPLMSGTQEGTVM